jgi:hypothetical protein
MLVLNQSRLNREYNLKNALKTFVSNVTRNFLTEDYTETFYTLYKRTIPSIRCKRRLSWSNSMGEVQWPSLLFIGYVQLLHQASTVMLAR